MMKKVIYLFCFYIGLWGILGFLVSLIFGFISCCMNLEPAVFYSVLVLFAAVGIVSTAVCVTRNCYNKLS